MRILQNAAEIDQESAREFLAASHGELKTAIVAARAAIDPDTARRLLDEHQGSVRDALAAARP